MIKLLKRLFGTRRRINHMEEFLIDDNMPLPIGGVEYKDVLKVKGYLDRVGVGQSFPVELRLDHAVRKIAREQFSH